MPGALQCPPGLHLCCLFSRLLMAGGESLPRKAADPSAVELPLTAVWNKPCRAADDKYCCLQCFSPKHFEFLFSGDRNLPFECSGCILWQHEVLL